MSYGGSSGNSRIATAADTALSNPLSGDALTYNATLQKWVNGSVSKVGGIMVSGTPSVGQALIASSASAASWQTVTGSSSGNTATIDGGSPTSVYGGTTSINGGTP